MIQTWTCRLCGGVISLGIAPDGESMLMTHHFYTHHFNELIEVTTKEDDK